MARDSPRVSLRWKFVKFSAMFFDADPDKMLHALTVRNADGHWVRGHYVALMNLWIVSLFGAFPLIAISALAPNSWSKHVKYITIGYALTCVAGLLYSYAKGRFGDDDPFALDADPKSSSRQVAKGRGKGSVRRKLIFGLPLMAFVGWQLFRLFQHQ